MTRLRSYSDAVLEAGWLAAVILVPTYFNIFSNRVFEADKITVLRIIVAVMALAQLVKWEESLNDTTMDRACQPKAPWRNRCLSNRLALPALIAVATFLISTALSITPAISLWGSYTRLQGTYSMLTYVALFFLTAGNLSRRDQLDRLFSAVLLASLPISLYGVAQHFHFDPVSWQGDATTRVTSTMGNPIFLSAYLIMVVPITLQRLFVGVHRLRTYCPVGREDLLQGLGSLARPATYLSAVFFLIAIFVVAVQRNPLVWWATLPMVGLLVVAATALTVPQPTRLTKFVQAVGYVVLLLAQVTALLLSGSRGPWIGLIAGAACFAIAIAARSESRRVLATVLAVPAAAVTFLVLFNLPATPLAPLRGVPYLGSLGTVADTRIDTVRVRLLIWTGTWELLTTRPPIGLAEGDPIGPVRSLVGYGPESMFVAFNKVYQPELAHYEARRASPDRNHNDILDYLLNVGILGLAAYWFLLVMAFRLAWRQLARAPDFPAYALVAGVVGALVAHVVELLSGIAISVSLTYFWVYLAILAAMARGLSNHGSKELAQAVETADGTSGRVKAGTAVMAFGAIVLVVVAVLSQVAEVEHALMAVALSFVGLAVAMILTSRALGRRPSGTFCRVSRIPIYVLAVASTLGIILANLNAIAADVYFKRALASDREGELANSVAQFNEALRLAGDQDYYYLYLGRAYLRLAETTSGTNASRAILFNAGRIALERARDLNPLNTDHYANLGRLYRSWGALEEPDKLEAASDYYRQAATLSPRSAHLYNEWGQVDVARGELEAALGKTLEAAAIDPEFDQTFVLLGDIHMLGSHPEEALVAHRRALSINPATFFGLRFEQRIASYERWALLPQVEEAYLDAVERFPDSPEAHKGYGHVLVRRNKLREALAEFETSARLRQDDLTSRLNLASIYKTLGLKDQAVASAEEALLHAPTDRADDLRRLIEELRKEE